MNAAAEKREVVVIGAGVVGACCAAYLALEGRQVTLLEAEEPGAGASSGNAGAISPGSCLPLSMPGVLRKVPSWLLKPDGPLVVRPRYAFKALPWLMRFVAAGAASRVDSIADALRALHGATHDCYRPLLDAAGANELIRRTGALVVYRTDRSFEAAQREWRMRRERGAQFEVLDGPTIRELVPALAPTFERAVLQPDHGYVVDPKSLVQALVEVALGRGGRLVRGRASAITADGSGVEIRLDSGEMLTAADAVICAGAWSGELLRRLNLTVPLETQRGYHLHLADPSIQLKMPVSFADGKFYATPMRTGLRMAGTVEFAGLGAPADYSRAEKIGKLAQAWLPGLELNDAQRWMGHRPCLPDSLPVIGQLPGGRRVWLAFGHGHNGMTAAPVTGRLIADMITGRPPVIDPTPYNVERFN